LSIFPPVHPYLIIASFARTGVNKAIRLIEFKGQGDNMDKKKIAALVVALLAAIAGLVATWGGTDKVEAEQAVEEAAKPVEAPAVTPAPAAAEAAPAAETVVVPATEATPAPAASAAK
jgi:hypothetical protein